MRVTAAIAALAALTAACDGERSVRISSSTERSSHDGVLKVVSQLQCPETMGGLTRKGSAQAEGSVCTYGGPRGAEVALHLIPLNDQSPETVLTAFEEALRGAMPLAHAALQPTPPAPPGTEPSAGADAAAGDEEVAVNLPGMGVEAEGDRAQVRLPGMSVEADGDRAQVRIGGISIQADEGSSKVEIASDDGSVNVTAQNRSAEVRARAAGEAIRMTYILTDDRPSEAGWRMVGYEARGPRGGPIVVATVRSRDRQADSLFEDAKALVRLNVGE